MRHGGCGRWPGFGDTIQFVGGLNKPKLVRCMDSTGASHRQLVKSGMDDLRQDAVMQQFFGLVNNFLQASAPTHKRQLRIATYKVRQNPRLPIACCFAVTQNRRCLAAAGMPLHTHQARLMDCIA